MQLSFNFDDNATAEAIAHKLRMQAGLLEGLTPKEAASRKNTTAKVQADAADDEAEEQDTTADDEDDNEDFGTTKKSTKKAAAAAFDDDADEETEEEAEEKTVKKSAKKAPKITEEMVNAACRDRAIAEGGGKKGRAVVEGILKKKFKTLSVSSIKPEDRGAVIEAMEG